MAKRYDAAIKDLVERYPADWLAQLGIPSDLPVQVVDADVSTVTAQADKVYKIGGETPWIIHWEFQTAWDSVMRLRLLL